MHVRPLGPVFSMYVVVQPVGPVKKKILSICAKYVCVSEFYKYLVLWVFLCSEAHFLTWPSLYWTFGRICPPSSSSSSSRPLESHTWLEVFLFSIPRQYAIAYIYVHKVQITRHRDMYTLTLPHYHLQHLMPSVGVCVSVYSNVLALHTVWTFENILVTCISLGMVFTTLNYPRVVLLKDINPDNNLE